MSSYNSKHDWELTNWVAAWALDRSDLTVNQKNAVMYYVCLCDMKFSVASSDQARAIAERWVAGKRKVTPPGHSTKKKLAAERRKMLSSVPAELLTAIESACVTTAAEQYKGGNEKALNSLVGLVMRQYRYDAAVVKDLLQQRLQ